MASIHFGTQDGSTLVPYATKPEKKLNKSGEWEFVYKYWCKAASAESLAPAIDTACTDPGHTDLKVTGVSIRDNGTPEMADVEVTYALNAGEISAHKDGDTQQSSDTEWREIPLEAAEAGGLITSQKKAELEGYNQKTVGVVSVSYTYTKWDSSFTWSEANIIASVGTLCAPTGMTSPTSGKWLFTRKAIRKDGHLNQTDSTWQYDKAGWNNIATL